MSGPTVEGHLDDLRGTLDGVRAEAGKLDAWGRELAARLTRGHRLLAAGNGGTAAEAQHLTAELVGRYRGEREPFSALALHADTSALTALGNDYGFDEVFARQVRAHGRPGDVLVLFSTSGRSENLLAAAEAAGPLGVTVWCLTGPAPNPLAAGGDDAICLPGPAPAVQEAQLVAVHLLCEVVDRELARRPARPPSVGEVPSFAEVSSVGEARSVGEVPSCAVSSRPGSGGSWCDGSRAVSPGHGGLGARWRRVLRTALGTVSGGHARHATPSAPHGHGWSEERERAPGDGGPSAGGAAESGAVIR